MQFKQEGIQVKRVTCLVAGFQLPRGEIFGIHEPTTERCIHTQHSRSTKRIK